MSMLDVVDLVEQSKEVLDDVWRQIEFEPSYPETRMVRLMDVIGRGLNLLKLDDHLFIFGEIESCFKKHLFFCCCCFCVQGGDLGRYVQRKLSGVKIFAEPFLSVKENLRTGVSICEQWVAACEHLTGQVRTVTAERSALHVLSEDQTKRSVSVVAGEFSMK